MKLSKKTLVRLASIVTCIAIVIGTLVIVSLSNKQSIAYLYDEHKITVDYSVAQLKFDLSSNHMYKYYTDDPIYVDKFEVLLNSLNGLISDFDSGISSLAAFDPAVKTALATYYDQNMLDSLQTAWDNNNTDQVAYDEATRSIYNTYYTYYDYLFKMKNLVITSVETGKSIWYYYADDLIKTYYDEYVIQNNATGVRQSTMKIGVKLKGGTTYSNDVHGDYFDLYFDDMVTTCTFKFYNEGNVSMYLNLDTNMYPTENADKGILAMVLPYGVTWDVLVDDAVYGAFYNATTEKWAYRALIKQLLSDREADFINTAQGTVQSDVFGSLTYASTQTLLNEWNAYALETYETAAELGINENGNIIVVPKDSTQQNVVKEINISMLFWADYEKCAEYYAIQNDDLEWKSDDVYELIQYDFDVDIKASLKNSDMSQYTPVDWGEMYNQRQIYEKFAGVSNFDVEGYAYFESTSGGVTTVENAKNFMEGGYIICNYVDPSAINYIFNLRFNVIYRGFSPAYIRVRFIEQFTNTAGDIEAVNRLTFDLGDSWIDHRAVDLYFYSNKQFFSTDNASLSTLGKPKRLSIPVIKGMESSITSVGDIDTMLNSDTTMKLKMTFFVEAVQPNRTEEYWSLTVDEINSYFE